MVSEALTDVIKRAEALTPEEQRELISHLEARHATTTAQERPRRSLMEFYGIARYPLVGEDAQTWVTRMRREGEDSGEGDEPENCEA